MTSLYPKFKRDFVSNFGAANHNRSRSKMAIITTFLFLTFISSEILAQTPIERNKILQSTNVDKLNKLRNDLQTDRQARKQNAEQLAIINGWEVKKFDKDGNFMELMDVTPDGNPLYYMTTKSAFFNLGAATTTRASALWTGGSLGLDLNGENMVVGEWDGGAVRLSHQEFDGNDDQTDNAPTIIGHATHVAGTLVGLGTNPTAKGMASAASLSAHDWTNDEAEMADAAADGLLISNHSYGLNPIFLSTWNFGYYDSNAKAWDDIQYNAPFYLVVQSAGNDRNDGLNTSKNGYDLMTGSSNSKNALVVAAVNEVANYTGPSSVVMSNFSSWGPTDDGRIKPDISAKGVSLTSAWNTSNTAYAISSGTSMSAPNTTGSLILLQQHYNNLNGEFMLAATLKGIAINTAEEAGDGPGPDYEFGWGLLNVEKGAMLISNEDVSSIIEENTLNDGGSYVTTVNSDGTQPLDLTIVWTESGHDLGPTGVVDNTDPRLNNDLDVRITSGSTTYEPWILDPANPSFVATTGDNFRDNVEVINIENPPAGEYTITVTHKGSLEDGPQDFSLIVNGVAAGDPPVCEALVPTGLGSSAITENSASISWSVVPLVASYDYRYRATGSTTWTDVNTTSTSAAIAGLAPETEYEFQVRSNCTESSSAYSASSLFTTLAEPEPCEVETPTGLSVSGISDSEATFSWDAEAEAASYDYRYRATGATDWTTANTTATSASISGLEELTDYEVQVRAICVDETSAYSASVNFTTEEGSDLQPCNIAPQNITADATSDATTLSWDPVENVNFYQYRWRPSSGGAWTNGTTTTNSLSLTGLSPETSYSLNIRSSCSTGSSPVASFSWTTAPEVAEPCSQAPFDLSAGNITETSAEISYTTTATDVEEYNYRFRVEGTATWTEGSTSDTQVVLSSLTEATTYEYQVQSVCNSGSETSDWSVLATFTTLSSGGGGTTPCDEVPQNFTVSTTGSTATIDWSPVDGAILYQYRYRSTGAWTNGTTTSNSLALSGLSANTNYTLMVRTWCGSFSPLATINFSTSSSNATASEVTEILEMTDGSLARGLQLYPNPAQLKLNIGLVGIRGNISINIIDTKGVQIRHFNMSGGVEEIDVSDLPKGIYFLKASNESETINQRFVVE